MKSQNLHFVSEKLFRQLEEKLKVYALDEDNLLRRAELSLLECETAIKELKKFILKYRFKNVGEEIKFFKEVKPLFFSKLIFFVKVFNIETKKPTGSDRAQKRYYEYELDRLQKYFDNNLEFYQYYRMQSTFLDEKYFRRGKFDIRLTLDTFFFETDPRFSSSHDFKVSKILANDLLAVHLKGEIAALERKEDSAHKPQGLPKVKLTWTDSKTAMIELIYAMHSSAVFNNGNVDIKNIATYFEVAFNIDLGDYYRTWLEVKERKSSRTKFLDSLKANLVKRIDEREEK